jgi:hypothetical protein
MTQRDRDNFDEEFSLDEPLAMADEEEEEIELAEGDKTDAKEADEEDETISLIDDEELGQSQVRAFGGAASKMGAGHKADFQRDLNTTGQGATRCRIFHSKLAATSLEYMEKQINDWIDSDPTIDVKQVGHTIGVMTGKTAETSLIVTVWY